MSNTDQAVQLQKVARVLKLQIKEVDGLYYVAKTKALISCPVQGSWFVSLFLHMQKSLSIVQFIFYSWSFEISINILRNQKIL